MMTDAEQRRNIMAIALIVAAIVVVGVVLWMTNSFPQKVGETGPITVAPAYSPSPLPISRISPEAAITVAPGQVAGTSTTAETGPAEWALTGAMLVSLVGLGGSLWLFKLA